MKKKSDLEKIDKQIKELREKRDILIRGKNIKFIMQMPIKTKDRLFRVAGDAGMSCAEWIRFQIDNDISE